MVSNTSQEPGTGNTEHQQENEETSNTETDSFLESSSRNFLLHKNVPNNNGIIIIEPHDFRENFRSGNGSARNNDDQSITSSTEYTLVYKNEKREMGTNQRGPRSFKYISKALSLEDTEFCTKIELTADYQGSSVLSASNEHYGPANNMIKTTVSNLNNLKRNLTPKENEEDGLQDGWLVKRNEIEANAKIRLGVSGIVCGVDIDTTGYIQCAPLTANLFGRLRDNKRMWTKILPKVLLKSNSHNFFATKDNPDIYDQILITMTPGGGIHRLRVFGDVIPLNLPFNRTINLSSNLLGAQIVSRPRNILRKEIPNLIIDRANSSQDGWICPRDYHDDNEPQYTIIKLAAKGVIDHIVVDTTHFIGNSPKSVLIEGCCVDDEKLANPNDIDNISWIRMIDATDTFYRNLHPNMYHIVPCIYQEPVTHVRIQPIPDGGIQQVLFKGKIYQRDEQDPFIDSHNATYYIDENNKKRKRNLDDDGYDDIQSGNNKRQFTGGSL